MDMNSFLEKLDQYSTDQIKDIQFKFEKDIYFTYVMKPEFHDAVLKACELQLKRRMN